MNISVIKDCYGCGVCSAVCARNVIEMKLNNDGFYEPRVVRQSACTDCGLCLSVCAYKNDFHPGGVFRSYAAWSKDENQRHVSTSGGVSAEVAKYLVAKGYKFCGVKYNPVYNIAEHYIAENVNQLEQSYGSKYLQSYTETAFRSIDRKQKHIIVGTPCQIASFHRYIQRFKCEDNFVLVDFFCHGVPSKLMWDKYIQEHGFSTGSIDFASWRNKEKGWKKSYCITLSNGDKTHKSWSGKDDFFSMFLGDACLGKACYDHCKFKYDQSSADIRIGDLWGSSYIGNQKGVCAAIAFTQKGDEVLTLSNVELHEHPFEVVAEGQMQACAKRPWYYKKAMSVVLDHSRRLSEVTPYIRLSKKMFRQWKKIKNKFNRITPQ